MNPASKSLTKVREFEKIAGLLKVPEKILAQANDFVLSAWAKESINNLSKKIEIFNSTKLELKEIELAEHQISNIIEAMLDIVHSLPKSFDRHANTLSELLGNNVRGYSIPFYELSKDGDNNVWDPEISAGKIKFFALDDSTYYVFLNLSLLNSDFEDKIFTYKSEHASEAEIQNEFSQFIPLLQKIVTELKILKSDHISTINTNKSTAKSFVEARAFLVPFAKNSGTQLSIDFNGSDVPYVNKNIKGTIQLGVTVSDKVKVMIMPGNWLGLWQSFMSSETHKDMSLGRLMVHAPPLTLENYSKVNEIISDIKDTTRHELQHFIQSFIEYGKLLTDSAGMPSKKIRDKRFNPSGYPVNEGLITKEEIEEIDKKDPANRVLHQLRDVEFYTDLTDSVEIFKRLVKNLPLMLHKDFAKFCIGEYTRENWTTVSTKKVEELAKKQNPDDAYNTMVKMLEDINTHVDFAKMYEIKHFFGALRRYQSDKYEKAVKEFYKAVGL